MCNTTLLQGQDFNKSKQKPNEALYELYDIDKDPGKTTNLYFQHPEIVKSLKDKISKISINGRSTDGSPQPFVMGDWKQLTWMSFN